MGKGRRETGERRLVELRGLAVEAGFSLVEFSVIHCRIFGATTVDYWPTSGRIWRTGSAEKAFPGEPKDAISVARQSREVVEGDSATAHMKAIRDEGATERPPWED